MVKTNTNLLRFGNIAAFIITLAINGLAGTTLLNGRTTAQVSDLYSNPFTPAGYVFRHLGNYLRFAIGIRCLPSVDQTKR